MKIRKLSIILLILLILLTVDVIAANNVIYIPNQVKVKGMKVRLEEIAKINGSKEFKEKLKDITVGQTPLPGYQRIIYRDEVIYALKRKGVDLSKIYLEIPYQFSVEIDYKILEIDRLITKGKEYIVQQLEDKSQGVEISIVNPPRDLKIPYGRLEIEVLRKQQNSLLGRVMIPIKVIIDDKVYKRIYLQYRVEFWEKVLVAKDRIERGTKIDNSLFEVEEKLITNNYHQFVSADDDLSGKRMKSFLQAGYPLLKRMVELPHLVKRWSEISLIAKIGGVEIVTTGKAREDGHLGDIIKVENISSKKIVKGRVIAKNKVEVLLD